MPATVTVKQTWLNLRLGSKATMLGVRCDLKFRNTIPKLYKLMAQLQSSFLQSDSASWAVKGENVSCQVLNDSLHLKRTLPRAFGKNCLTLHHLIQQTAATSSLCSGSSGMTSDHFGRPFWNNPTCMSLGHVEPLELVELEPWVPLQLGENPTLGIYLSQDILHVSVCLYAFYQNPENYSTMANGIQWLRYVWTHLQFVCKIRLQLLSHSRQADQWTPAE